MYDIILQILILVLDAWTRPLLGSLLRSCMADLQDDGADEGPHLTHEPFPVKFDWIYLDTFRLPDWPQAGHRLMFTAPLRRALFTERDFKRKCKDFFPYV
jgi:hypothetical protein